MHVKARAELMVLV